MNPMLYESGQQVLQLLQKKILRSQLHTQRSEGHRKVNYLNDPNWFLWPCKVNNNKNANLFYNVYCALYNIQSCKVTLLNAITMVQVTNLTYKRRNLIKVFWFTMKLASSTVIKWHPYVNISELCSAVGVEITLRAERRAVRISAGQTTLLFS